MMSRSDRNSIPAPVLGISLLVAAGLLLSALPCSAKILKTRRTGQPGHRLPITVGSGFEYESDGVDKEYAFPFLLEYGITPLLKLSAEPSYISINTKDEGKVSGMGDLETTLAYEVIPETRYRPGITPEGIVKWPTASRNELGTGETDYSLGVILSKAFGRIDTDFNAVYTFIGSPPGVKLDNTLDLSLAAEWRLNSVLNLEGEVVTSNAPSGFRGRPGSIGGLGGPGVVSVAGGRETEGTLGLVEALGGRLKLEEGMILRSDGSWQAVVAWEWDLSRN